jgi:hypothetical protein
VIDNELGKIAFEGVEWPDRYATNWGTANAHTKQCFNEAAQAVAAHVSAPLLEEIERLKDARKHTQDWYARHYGKLHDWARKRLPEPWITEFFNCVANGTWGHEDIGTPYVCKAGFSITPTNYLRTDTAEGQLLRDQTQRAEDAELYLASANAEIERLKLEAKRLKVELEVRTMDRVPIPHNPIEFIASAYRIG